MDDRTIAQRVAVVDPLRMEPTLVRCLACDRAWHSPTLAEGLREVGSCPRCGGELAWAENQRPAPRNQPEPQDIAPHLVLGVPRHEPR